MDEQTRYKHAKVGEVIAGAIAAARIARGEDPEQAQHEARLCAEPWVTALNDGSLILLP